MPPRSTRHNARTSNKQSTRALRTTPPLSPPAQLPTPLPEERKVPPSLTQHLTLQGDNDVPGDDGTSDMALSHLIDFDTPTPPQAAIHLPATEVDMEDVDRSVLFGDDDDEDLTNTYTYRSPPFREASLPEESPPPLPVPPRAGVRSGGEVEGGLLLGEGRDAGYGGQYGEGYGNVMSSSGVGRTRAPNYSGRSSQIQTQGNTTRSPTYSRSPPAPSTTSPSPISPTYSYTQHNASPSTFESISRTIRGYVPSAAPSPPQLSRPVSFGRFSARQPQDDGEGHQRQEFERDYERDDEGTGHDYGYGYGHARTPSATTPGYGYATPSQAPGQGVQQLRLSSPHRQTQAEPAFAGSGLARAMRRGNAPAPAVVASHGHGQVRRGAGAGGVAAYPRGASRVGGGSGRGRAEGREGGGLGNDGGRKWEQADRVEWARWDVLGDRRTLLIAYRAGLQIWDCSDLGAISEVLNLNFDSAEWGLMLGQGQAGGTAVEGVEGLRDGVRDDSERVRVVHAAMLPSPKRLGSTDVFTQERPLLGILLETANEDDPERNEESTLVLYSLRNHHVVKRLAMANFASTFLANEHFIVISTTSPPTLHILSSSTFQFLHIIPSASLEAFIHPSSSSHHSTALSISQAISATAQSTLHKPVSLVGLSIDNDNRSVSGKASPHDHRRHADPHPVFALSGRLLAYASPSQSSSPSFGGGLGSKALRRLSSSSTGSGTTNPNSSLSSSPFGLGMAMPKVTQADLGHAALKVGETVFSGMKFLGGMAYGAAKSRVGGGAAGDGRFGVAARTGRVEAAPDGRFVSRSAPDSGVVEEDAAARRLKERRYSNTSALNANAWDQHDAAGSSNSSAYSSAPTSGHAHLTTITPSTGVPAESGYYATVVDLASLFHGSGIKDASPVKVDEFRVSRSQPVADIRFSSDGTNLVIVPRDGHLVKTFKLRPAPAVLLPNRRLGGGADVTRGAGAGSGGSRRSSPERVVASTTAMHVYELRRGRTSAVVENVDWAKDGRWLAIGTRKRTVHVFPVNPYGGTADVASHLEGRVRNVDVIQPPLTELAPVARIRGAKASPPDQAKAPLAFIFISPVDISTSPRLRPPSSPNLTADSPSSPLFSPQKTTNFQDVLLFDPMDGILSLRRLTLDKQLAHEPGVAASVQALGVTSISLPGMGGAGRMSGSPSMRGGGGGRMLGLTATVSVAELPMELVGKEGTVATWDLQRGRDWVEIKQPMGLDERTDLRRGRLTSGDWLSEAELSTCSSSQRVLPRSLYLSHQFSFHTLGEDYHALIRGYQFDISGAKIEVRKEVEISAYSSSTRDDSAFVEGFSAPRDIRRTSSSFDEPIASAILGSFDNSNLPIILPMYPNGIPGSKPKSFRNSIPIRTMTGIGDGVTEGLGRIRREMHKARSPQLVARSDSSLSGHVPLEFDEEDEDFLLRDTLAIPSQDSNEREDVSTSRDTSRGGASADSASSIATPASDSTHQLLDADVVGTVDEEIWDGWDPQDKLAVEEAEGFDDISAVGYLDEGREHIPAVSVAMSKRKGRLRRKG